MKSGLAERIGFLSALVLLCVQPAAADEQVRPAHPNIVVILADDMGWKDVGYHGSEIETPNLDRLAASGAELDRFYAMPTCSPTRAALLTGQLPLRLGVLSPLSKNNPKGLPLDRKLLPQFLEEAADYQTALSGKWHLGYLDRAYQGIGHTSCLPAQRPSMGVMLNTQGEPRDGPPPNPIRLGSSSRRLKSRR